MKLAELADSTWAALQSLEETPSVGLQGCVSNLGMQLNQRLVVVAQRREKATAALLAKPEVATQLEVELAKVAADEALAAPVKAP
jgi:hypothetical protein